MSWLGLIIFRLVGYEVDPIVIATLMGGSIVGIAYRAERFLRPKRSSLSWKTAFMIFGFGTAYFVASEKWVAAVVAITILLFVAFFFLGFKRELKISNAKVAEIEKKLEDYCE